MLHEQHDLGSSGDAYGDYHLLGHRIRQGPAYGDLLEAIKQ